MSWELNRVGDICKVKSGKRLPKGMSVQDEPTTRKYLRVTDLKSHVVDESDIKYISEDIFKLISRYTISCDDIYISIAGTIGKVGIIPASIDGISLTENCCKLTELNKSKIIQHFLLHYLRSYEGQSKMQAKTGGASQPKLAITRLKDILIPTPPIQTQNHIADILSAYDDLIENNLKRIKLLEQAAQNIYKEWFVHLRFPGYENAPINEETGLPVGWEVCTINDVCEKVASGGTPSRRNKSYWDNPKYPWVTTKELRDGFILDVKESVSEEGLKNSSAKLFPKGTILMAIYASPTLGRLGILSREACCNQAAVGFICDNTKISNQFLYYTLYSERANLNAIAIGAAQQNINVGKVKAHEIILPPFHFVERFTSITSSNYEMRLNLVTQNQKLKAARDILLPRLMNRTIEV